MIIKRYQNRKLYSPQLAKYVNLTELLQLYRDNNNLQVIDVDSQDITTKTLLSALYEVELIHGVTREEIDRRLGGL